MMIGIRYQRRAFTLVELTVVLALIAILMGLVIVRLGGFTPRQRLIQEARKLGNLIEGYRERAVAEEAIYVLTLDTESGAFQVRKPAERSLERLDRAPLVRSGILEGVHVKAVRIQNKEIAGPLVMRFGVQGIQPAWTILLEQKESAAVSLHIDPLLNEVRYDER